jgi:hypothetical protein
MDDDIEKIKKLLSLRDQGFTGWVRIHLSPNHIFSAFHLAKLSQEVEKHGNQHNKMTREQHRSFVIGAIFSSVAFIEASINELYSAAADAHFHTPKLEPELKQRLSALWILENFRRTARTLEKYQCALQLAGKKIFDIGMNPYQDAKNLIDIRNALIHFIPRASPIQAEPDVEIPLDEFGRRLQGKFPENPWKPQYALIHTGPESEKATWPFFPEGCLGSGCAQWAATSALNFVDDFFAALDLKWYYDHLREELKFKDDKG